MFDVMSPLNGGSFATYGYRSESPFDLDAGLDYTRQATGFAPMPFPVVIGWVDGFIPLQNDLERSIMRGKVPTGPWTGQQSALNSVVFPNIMGSLAKVTG